MPVAFALLGVNTNALIEIEIAIANVENLIF
jgi:hypothetical protein